ncbi:hypothetical protein JOM56_010156 [Amanita muscaria]
MYTIKQFVQAVTRSLMIKMINALTAKIEKGSPMASLYLLGNPDHYTSHQFVNVFWKNYVRVARSAWNFQQRMKDPQKLFSVKTMEN